MLLSETFSQLKIHQNDPPRIPRKRLPRLVVGRGGKHPSHFHPSSTPRPLDFWRLWRLDSRRRDTLSRYSLIKVGNYAL